MTASGWRPGDLGRAKVARDDRPQFEAVSAGKDGVVVWHHMCTKHDVIPVSTFRRDFTPTWKLAHAVPAHGIARGQVYTMASELPLPRDYVGKGLGVEANVEYAAALHIRGRNLRVRRVQHDYASCEVVETDVLVIVPVDWITRWGAIYTTLWEHLEGDWSL